MRRKIFLAGLLSVGLLATGLFTAVSVQAATQTTYNAAAFAAAQAAGKPILVAVHAPWCPICAKQRPILADLAKDPAFADMVMMTVDFDSQKDVVKAFGVQKQSTLIVVHGSKETDRSTGVTYDVVIRKLLETSKN